MLCSWQHFKGYACKKVLKHSKLILIMFLLYLAVSNKTNGKEFETAPLFSCA